MATEPKFSVTTERIYDKLPDIYREADAANGFAFKRYISLIGDTLGDVDLLVERFRYRSQIELEYRKRYSQRNTVYTQPGRDPLAPVIGSTSDLVDPTSADAAWLPWLGQLVGVKTDPNASVANNRDAIRFAASGFRAGSKYALEKAVRAVLTGSKYALAMPATKVDANGNLVAGSVWDITIVTRNGETPSSFTVLQQVNKDELKPAGVKLYHRTYTASWDALEASLPYWRDWETKFWDDIEQIGISYAAIQGNLLPNPSFETNTDGWLTSGPITMTRVTGGGVDGTAYLRGDASGTGYRNLVSPAARLEANKPYVYGISYKSTTPVTFSIYDPVSNKAINDLNFPASNVWKRIQSGFMPTSAQDYRLVLATATGGVNDSMSIDAGVLRAAS